MRKSIRTRIRERAGRRCEYCRFRENDLPLFRFHVEHIIPLKHGGSSDPENLAWSCHSCNLSKSSNLSGRDVVTGRVVSLFNPRRQHWHRHFAVEGPRIVGLTPCGRATIAVLNFNAPRRVEIRKGLLEAGPFSTE
jgi:hypothetical protein